MSEIGNFYDFESTYYDKIYGLFSQDISFYKAMEASPPYLEIFAGTGRIISKFSHGIGLEINPNMLRKTSNSFIKVMGDARNLPFKRHFNTVIVGLNSLLLVPNDQKSLIFREARRVLNRNGVLFVDLINGFILKRGVYNISEFNDGRTMISLKMKAKKIKNRYRLKYSYTIKGRSKRMVEKTITIYPITFGELREMLRSGDFRIEGVYGDYDLSPYNEDSEKLLVKARAV